MPDRVTTSFIPKESLVSERAPKSNRKNPLVFVNIVAAAILIVAVLASGGMFLLKSYTEQSIVSKRESLNFQRSAFEPSTIEELLRLDKRLTASHTLLRAHTALSVLFADIEAKTNINVRFKNFKYEPTGSGRYLIGMSGTARSFNSVALQSDAFGKSTILKDPIFSNLNLDQNGEVVFEFTAYVDTARISYAALLAGALPGVQQTPPAEDVTPQTP